jgi:hypothetical protein
VVFSCLLLPRAEIRCMLPCLALGADADAGGGVEGGRGGGMWGVEGVEVGWGGVGGELRSSCMHSEFFAS